MKRILLLTTCLLLSVPHQSSAAFDWLYDMPLKSKLICGTALCGTTIILYQRYSLNTQALALSELKEAFDALAIEKGAVDRSLAQEKRDYTRLSGKFAPL